MIVRTAGWKELRPDRGHVGAAFVTYHPDPGLAVRVRALSGQVAHIVIVDNGSSELELAPIRDLVTEGTVALIPNGANLGVATALNQGLAWGEERGLDWIVTFDQDSAAEPRLVAEAARVYDAHHPRIAVIGAGWVSRLGLGTACNSPDGIEVTHVITSGALHHVGIWRVLGGFREDLFIDYVDTEYCLRARTAGYSVVQGCVPTMTHAIGSPTRRRLINRFVTPSNHDRARRYYMTRNRMFVWRSYWRRESGYVVYDMKAAAKELIKLLLFETDRVGKLRAVLAGARDSNRLPRAMRSTEGS